MFSRARWIKFLVYHCFPREKNLCKNVHREYSVHHSSICRKIVENPIFWLPIIFYNSKIASLKDIMKFACKNSKHALVAIELGFRYLHLRKRKFSQIMIYDTKIVFTYYTMKWMQFVCTVKYERKIFMDHCNLSLAINHTCLASEVNSQWQEW